jgi:hypothetical protein
MGGIELGLDMSVGEEIKVKSAGGAARSRGGVAVATAAAPIMEKTVCGPISSTPQSSSESLKVVF